jgi:TPR repeat protein
MLRPLTKRGWRDDIALLGRQADAGEVSAMTDLGLNLLEGIQDRKGRSIVRRNPRMAVTWFRQAAKRGDHAAASSLGYAYDVGLGTGLAFQWWKRAADMHDGDAAVDVGYCYQYGIGTRKNAANAKRMFRRAIASRDVSQYGREEALYHLAVQFIDEGKRQLAFPVLKRATADDDFPEAASVLNQLKTKSVYAPCRCKRSINKRLRGHTKCSLHAR